MNSSNDIIYLLIHFSIEFARRSKGLEDIKRTFFCSEVTNLMSEKAVPRSLPGGIGVMMVIFKQVHLRRGDFRVGILAVVRHVFE